MDVLHVYCQWWSEEGVDMPKTGVTSGWQEPDFHSEGMAKNYQSVILGPQVLRQWMDKI